MSSQTFIFCVGATKAGTSWLFDYLRHHEECYFPAVKELHYFDALETGNGGWHRKRMIERLERARVQLADATDERPMPFQARLIKDLEQWLDAFDGKTANDAGYLKLLGAGGPAKLIGDFTPSYGLLKEATLATMAKLTDRVRFVYLMRDPVDRLWSNIRMNAGKDMAEIDRKVEGYLSGAAVNIIDRSNYRRTLNRLTQVIPREALHIEFYERLFTPEAIERLCAFLGITPQPAQFEKVVHGGAFAHLGMDRRAQLQATLKPQYNFVDKFMGGLPTEWTDKMVDA